MQDRLVLVLQVIKVIYAQLWVIGERRVSDWVLLSFPQFCYFTNLSHSLCISESEDFLYITRRYIPNGLLELRRYFHTIIILKSSSAPCRPVICQTR